VRGVVIDFLREHFPLMPGEPTPSELKHALSLHNLRDGSVEKTVAWLQACDQARFAAALGDKASLVASSAHLLQALEVELCAPS
jgi:hypothetical protein